MNNWNSLIDIREGFRNIPTAYVPIEADYTKKYLYINCPNVLEMFSSLLY